MRRYMQSNREEALGHLNAQSIDDLKEIRDSLLAKDIAVGDLQFLVDEKGHVVINDPTRVYRGDLGVGTGVNLPHDNSDTLKFWQDANIRTINTLISRISSSLSMPGKSSGLINSDDTLRADSVQAYDDLGAMLLGAETFDRPSQAMREAFDLVEGESSIDFIKRKGRDRPEGDSTAQIAKDLDASMQMTLSGGSAFGVVTTDELLMRLPRLQKLDAIGVMSKLREFEAGGWTIELTRSTENYTLDPDAKNIELGRMLTSGNVRESLKQLDTALATLSRSQMRGSDALLNFGEEIRRDIDDVFDEIESWRDEFAKGDSEKLLHRAYEWLKALEDTSARVSHVGSGLGEGTRRLLRADISEHAQISREAFEAALNDYLNPASGVTNDKYAQRVLLSVDLASQDLLSGASSLGARKRSVTLPDIRDQLKNRHLELADFDQELADLGNLKSLVDSFENASRTTRMNATRELIDVEALYRRVNAPVVVDLTKVAQEYRFEIDEITRLAETTSFGANPYGRAQEHVSKSLAARLPRDWFEQQNWSWKDFLQQANHAEDIETQLVFSGMTGANPLVNPSSLSDDFSAFERKLLSHALFQRSNFGWLETPIEGIHPPQSYAPDGAGRTLYVNIPDNAIYTLTSKDSTSIDRWAETVTSSIKSDEDAHETAFRELSAYYRSGMNPAFANRAAFLEDPVGKHSRQQFSDSASIGSPKIFALEIPATMKPVNDQVGHIAADQLLQAVIDIGASLSQRPEFKDVTLYHLNAMRFAVEDDAAGAFAAQFQQALSRLDWGYTANGTQYKAMGLPLVSVPIPNEPTSNRKALLFDAIDRLDAEANKLKGTVIPTERGAPLLTMEQSVAPIGEKNQLWINNADALSQSIRPQETSASEVEIGEEEKPTRRATENLSRPILAAIKARAESINNDEEGITFVRDIVKKSFTTDEAMGGFVGNQLAFDRVESERERNNVPTYHGFIDVGAVGSTNDQISRFAGDVVLSTVHKTAAEVAKELNAEYRLHGNDAIEVFAVGGDEIRFIASKKRSVERFAHRFEEAMRDAQITGHTISDRKVDGTNALDAIRDDASTAPENPTKKAADQSTKELAGNVTLTNIPTYIGTGASKEIAEARSNEQKANDATRVQGQLPPGYKVDATQVNLPKAKLSDGGSVGSHRANQPFITPAHPLISTLHQFNLPSATPLERLIATLNNPRESQIAEAILSPIETRPNQGLSTSDGNEENRNFPEGFGPVDKVNAYGFINLVTDPATKEAQSVSFLPPLAPGSGYVLTMESVPGYPVRLAATPCAGATVDGKPTPIQAVRD
jgi:GGDEF domain-containing protein